MPLFASIDVGSNTLRLLIGKFVGNHIRDVYTRRETTRLGSLVDQTRMIQPETMEASLRALRGFASAIDRLQVKQVRAIGTSALREAGNSAIFMERTRRETGVPIEVISGEEEARLTLRGIIHAFSAPETKARHGLVSAGLPDTARRSQQRSLFIMDIGGGSSEWIVYNGEDKYSMGSLPSGVIKLAQHCIKADPPTRDDIVRLDGDIDVALGNLYANAASLLPENALFVGTGGTFTTIASVDLGLTAYSRKKIHLHRITLSRLRRMQEEFLRLSLMDRKHIRGLEPGRADLIIPGVQFTMKVMELYRFQKLIVSDYGLLEGALLEMKEARGKGIPEAGKS